jgi:hypothetical protein
MLGLIAGEFLMVLISRSTRMAVKYSYDGLIMAPDVPSGSLEQYVGRV